MFLKILIGSKNTDETKLEFMESKSRTYHHRHHKFWVRRETPMLIKLMLPGTVRVLK